MNNDFPKVLVISGTGLRASGNFGLTMASLFGGWPDCKMANLYLGPMEADDSICTRSLKLGLGSAIGYNVGRALFRNLKSPERQVKDDVQANVNVKNLDPRLKLNSYGVLRGLADMLPVRIGGQEWKWIVDWSPDLILSPLESIRVMNLAANISTKLRIPIVPFFADDWISTMYGNSILFSLPRVSLIFALKRVLQRARRGMAGSPSLATEYTSRFKKHFSTFVCPVAVPMESPPPLAATTDSQIVMIYAGRINLDRWQSLVDVGKALTSIGNSGINVRLDVYSLAEDLELYGARINGPPRLNVCGSLAPNEVFGKLVGGDILLHVESFAKLQRKFTRLSLSTKIPQYLAAGRPIFMYGPSEIGVTKHVRDSGAGVIVDSREIDVLAEAIQNLASSYELRRSLGRAGWEFAKRFHDVERVQCDLKKFLCKCV